MRTTRLQKLSLIIFLILSTISCADGCGKKSVEREKVMDLVVDSVAAVQDQVLMEEELEDLSEAEAEMAKEQMEAEIKAKEERVMGSVLLDFIEDPEGLINHLRKKMNDAGTNCTKISAFGAYLQECGKDDIYIKHKTSGQGPALKAIIKDFKKLKGNCKNP